MMDFGRVNLLPQDLRPQPISLRQNPVMRASAAGLVALALIGICVHQTVLTGRAEAKLKMLEQQQASLNNQITVFTAQQQAREEETQGRKDLLRRALGKTLWSRVFKSLSLAAPKDIWLNELTQTEIPEKGLKLLLVGESPSQASVAAFLKSLESAPHFSQVTLKFSEELEGFSPGVFRFQVECILLAPKPEAHRG